MEVWDWIIVTSGAAILLLVLVDVFLAVLHIDVDGIIGPRVFKMIWMVVIWLGGIIPGARRSLMALAGPLMMVTIFSLWLLLFILGYALVILPFMDGGYRSETELQALGLIDALYYAGVTVTVLGYGDITPLTGPLKVAVFVMSGLGFSLLTGIVTYLLNVVSGASARNALAVQVESSTGGSKAGADIIARRIAAGDVDGLRQNLDSLLRSMQTVQEQMHQFLILDLFYRSRSPSRDPEVVFRVLAEAALAAGVAVASDKCRNLKPVAEEMLQGVTRLMRMMGEKHLLPRQADRLKNPRPGEQEREVVRKMTDSLRPVLGEPDGWLEPPAELLDFVWRARTFLRGLDDVTEWTRDHRPGIFLSEPGRD